MGESRVRLPWGAEIMIEPASGSVGRSVWLLGVHDLLVCEILWRLTDRGSLAVDGGANIGQMTTLLRQRVGPVGRVVAFEPHPAIAERLERNLELSQGERGLGRVDVRRQALDASAGPRSLYEGEDFGANLGTASLVRSGERSIPIEAETLDRLFPTERIGVLKLDLEGAERAALEGAERLLEEGRIVHVVYEAANEEVPELVALLEGKGYRCFGLAQTLRGPGLRSPDGWGGPSYVAPSYLATREPEEVERRFEPRGWQCLRGAGRE